MCCGCIRFASHYGGNELCNYADNRPKYLIIYVVNVSSRSAELNNVNEWALVNNLKLNLAKTHEIILLTKCENKITST